MQLTVFIAVTVVVAAVFRLFTIMEIVLQLSWQMLLLPFALANNLTKSVRHLSRRATFGSDLFAFFSIVHTLTQIVSRQRQSHNIFNRVWGGVFVCDW